MLQEGAANGNSNQAYSNIVPESFLSLATVTVKDERVDDFFVDVTASSQQTFNQSILSDIRLSKQKVHRRQHCCWPSRSKSRWRHLLRDVDSTLWNGTSWTSVKISSDKYAPDTNFNLFSVGALPNTSAVSPRVAQCPSTAAPTNNHSVLR